MAVPNFGQMKELYSLQKKAKQMQKELKGLEIEAKSTDNLISVVVSGEMKIISIDIDSSLLNEEAKSKVERSLIDTIGQAMSRAQSESASRMQPLLKDMNFPGM
jgi:DNA-binding YbaB/EbfC family protein